MTKRSRRRFSPKQQQTGMPSYNDYEDVNAATGATVAAMKPQNRNTTGDIEESHLPSNHIGETSQVDSLVGSTVFDLFQRAVRGNFVIEPKSLFFPMFLGWIFLVVLLFVQDNSFGRLEDIAGIQWFVQAKFVSISIFGLFVTSILLIWWRVKIKLHKYRSKKTE